MEAAMLLKSAGEQLGKWTVEEAKYFYAVKDKVEELQSELEWINCFLRNADERRKDDNMIRKWISEIRNFSYEAEDILEKYFLEVSHPREDGIWNCLKWAICVAGDAMSTYEAGCEIDALINKLSKLSSRMIIYGVKPSSSSYDETGGSSSTRKADLRRTHSHLPVDDIVGLDEDTQLLVNQLLNNQTNVIAISDMAGAGKTTLARRVYQAVKGLQFEMCAWSYVSQKFREKDVIQEILMLLLADDKTEKAEIQNAPRAQLDAKLYRVLEQKKCLVVLDDLWKCSDWDCLKAAFPIGNSRSKLLITTRNKDLLSHVDPRGYSHSLRPLDHEESWQLFYRTAFLGKDVQDPNTEQLLKEMEVLGKQMVAKCKGLPLAIVVLGGILSSKRTLEAWRSVHKNVETFLSSKNDETIGVTDVLELSYTDLPFHLRPCFLHLANFPEDFEIPTKKLYRLWIAEGIVAPSNDKSVSLEDTANSYLRELMQRCLVQAVNLGSAGKIKSCRLHDLMWEMCSLKAKEENFLYVARQESTDVSYSCPAIGVEKLHRLAIHFGGSLQSAFSCQFNKASHLRSLIFYSSGAGSSGGQGWLKAMINDFKLLRVLDLENTGVKEVAKELGTLIHLRYLSIMGTQIEELPSSTANLRCLQTLDLRVCLPEKCVLRIPNVLWRMTKLKHLYLPSHANKVKRFRKLRINGLSSLEILKNFNSGESEVNDLGKLEKLRKLTIENEVSKNKTLKTILNCQSMKNQNLVYLSLKIHGAILNEDETILSSCSCLHTLELVGRNSEMAELRLENVKFPENLKRLAIRNCKLLCIDPMQSFKQLSYLKCLYLDKIWFSGTTMDCSNGDFLQLVDLGLTNMDTLEEWRVEGEAMPNLNYLYIYNCEKLKMIPDALPTSVRIVCHPCVNGIEKYLTCPYFRMDNKIVVDDDDDEDLGTRYCNQHLSQI